MGLAEAEGILELNGTGRMKIIISHRLDIIESPDQLARKIRETFTIENPRWIDNDRMSRWNGETDHWLTFYKNHPGGLTIPRGAMGLILYFCKEMGVRYQIMDQRRTLPEMDFTFAGILKEYQQHATTDILGRDFGVLQAPTGSGKTVMALSVIAERRQPCLIIVHSKELLSQWVERIEQFLGIPREEIGIIGNGKMKIDKRITVGIINSFIPSPRRSGSTSATWLLMSATAALPGLSPRLSPASTAGICWACLPLHTAAMV